MTLLFLTVAAVWIFASILVVACCVSAAQGDAEGWNMGSGGSRASRRLLRRPASGGLGASRRTRPVG